MKTNNDFSSITPQETDFNKEMIKEMIKINQLILMKCTWSYPYNFAAILSRARWVKREREIKFIGLFGDRGHRSPYSPYKPLNHNLYIGIIIFPHIDNPQSTGCNQPKKKTIKTRTTRTPAFWGYPPPPHDYPHYWVMLDPKSKQGRMDLEDIGQGQRSSHTTHLLMLVIICTKYGKNPSGTGDATCQGYIHNKRPLVLRI